MQQKTQENSRKDQSDKCLTRRKQTNKHFDTPWAALSMSNICYLFWNRISLLSGIESDWLVCIDLDYWYPCVSTRDNLSRICMCTQWMCWDQLIANIQEHPKTSANTQYFEGSVSLFTIANVCKHLQTFFQSVSKSCNNVWYLWNFSQIMLHVGVFVGQDCSQIDIPWWTDSSSIISLILYYFHVTYQPFSTK